MTNTPGGEWRDPNQPFGPPQDSQGWQQQPPQQGWQQQPQPQQQGWQQPGWGGPGQPYGYDLVARSRVVAGVLGILLGSLGVHNFYTGYHQFAWIQLGSTVGSVILTILTFGLFAPISSVVIPGIAIWGLVEGIMFLTQRTGRYSTDGAGRPLRD